MFGFVLFLLFSFPLFAQPPDPHDPHYDWMDALIEKDFRPFKEGIFRRSIDATENSHGALVRLKVIDNEVYPVKGDKGAAYGMLNYLAQTYGLPDLDILYFQHDGIEESIQGGAPIFCSSKRKWVQQGLYFVDWYTTMPHPGWDGLVEHINSILENLPWEQRKAQLIWRGKSTDGIYSAETWTHHRRGKLCALSLQYPDLIDARFNDTDMWRSRPDPETLAKYLPMGSSMSHAQQLEYKYQIILDGVFTTYPGDRWRLLSDSVVFMHHGDLGHWFYDALVPWVHYIPVAGDLHDLPEKIFYLREHEDFAKRLATNARDFALSYLMSDQIAVYCYKALLKYASLQQFSVTLGNGGKSRASSQRHR